MKKQLLVVLSITIFIAIAGFTIHRSPVEEVAYPEGYRKWTHVKSTFLDSTHPNVKYRGFSHIYGNDKAIVGYETGVFPDGSVVVVDVIEANHKDKSNNEGRRNHIDVMVKDGEKFVATGGWNFGQFEADRSVRILTPETIIKCSNCHASQKDYVFSEFRQ